MNPWSHKRSYWDIELKRVLAGRRGDNDIRLEPDDEEEWPTCDEYVDHYLREYGRRYKSASLRAQTRRLRRFRDDFRGRSLNLSRAEIKEWVYGEGLWIRRGPVPPSHVPALVSLYNFAIDEDDLPLTRSPARGLARRTTPGRANVPPPSRSEFEALAEACSKLHNNGEMMRSLFLFAAYTLMRPGELLALKWVDIDLSANRIRTLRRIYNGDLDIPKSGIRTIALTPPARDAIRSLPHVSDLVFAMRDGSAMSASMLSRHWTQVQEAAGLKFAFYHATRHYGVHYMWAELKMPLRAIAAQAGWKLTTAVEMLAIYGHPEIGALEDVDNAFRHHDDFLHDDSLRGDLVDDAFRHQDEFLEGYAEEIDGLLRYQS